MTIYIYLCAVTLDKAFYLPKQTETLLFFFCKKKKKKKKKKENKQQQQKKKKKKLLMHIEIAPINYIYFILSLLTSLFLAFQNMTYANSVDSDKTPQNAECGV